MQKNLLSIIILVVGLTFTVIAQTAKEKEPVKVHFIGNSYTYYQNLPQVLAIMAQSRNIELVTSKSVVGGAELREHWNNGSDDKPKWDMNTRLKLQNGQFDIVVLQDQSMMPVENPDSTLKYVRLFSEQIKNLNAKPLLYLTWAREKIPQMQKQLNKIYGEASRVNGIEIAPVGEAWKQARMLRPDIQLFSYDGTHPSYLGTYLAACTFFATITGEDPVGLPRVFKSEDKFGESIVLMILHEQDAAFLQTVARDVVKSWNK